MKKNVIVLCCCLAVMLIGVSCVCNGVCKKNPAGIFSVDNVYGNHMVLQRERPVQITGQAEPGSDVCVTLDAFTGVWAHADENGEWMAELKPMAAGGPHTITVTGAAGAEPVLFTDVLFGEVWICSGQSNMEMPVYSESPFWRDEAYEKVLSEAGNFPQIRIFNESPMKYVSPYQLQTQPRGKWETCTAESLAKFSAVGIQFGRQLATDLPGVPIGLVHISWSGTEIEPWISKMEYEYAGRTGELEQIKNIRTYTEEERVAAYRKLTQEYLVKYANWMDSFEAYNHTPEKTKDWACPDFDDSDWENPSDICEIFPGNFEGVAWMRSKAVIPDSWIGKDLILHLGAVDDCDWTYVNGKKVGQTLVDKPEYWAVNREYLVSAEIVNSNRLVVAVRIADLGQGGGLRKDGEDVTVTLAEDDSQKVIVDRNWKKKLDFSVDMVKLGGQPVVASLTDDGVSPHQPSTLYNSMVNPWIHYPVRGAIWYQGCSNAGNPCDYFILQQLLVEDWRRAWNNPDFAFIITQLAGHSAYEFETSGPDDWKKVGPNENIGFAPLREAQWFAMKKIPKCGMAVILDKGAQYDIHPHNKSIVGFRLAKEAERVCYGYKGVTSGPCYEAMKVVDDKAVLSFSNIGSGLMAIGNTEGRLGAFIISDVSAPDKFYFADAIIEGEHVVVSHPSVKIPYAVRYGWVSYSEAVNFYNKEGFPACPFRTDFPDCYK